MRVFQNFVAVVTCNFLRKQVILRTRKTYPVLSSRQPRNLQSYSGSDTCLINATIDTEDYVLKSPVNTRVVEFLISNNTGVKFIPKEIGKKFPNLKTLMVNYCWLSVLRSFFFKDMYNLKYLDLKENKIALVDAGAFEDQVNVNELNLASNLIETLEENLLLPMANLARINLNRNRIKFLNPATFKIPGGELIIVSLRENSCIDRNYSYENVNQLESDLKVNCAVIFL